MKTLSRDEMKKVMGGSYDPSKDCTSDSDCGTSEVECAGQTTSVKNKCNAGKCVHGGCPIIS